MKKEICIAAAVAVVAAVVFGCFFGLTALDSSTSARVRFAPDSAETVSAVQMSDEDFLVIRDIFNHRLLHSGHPSCGFSENVAVIVDGTKTFCIACDTCPNVYWKEKDKYFGISESAQKQLYEVLEKYGFSFPCV